MPTREPELYKDKIEVSLDGRQIFYLFFGGAVIVGLVFVVGVMVGRRVESRGHLDRADTQTASDPLAALDRLERSDRLSFHGALTGGEQTSDVEKTIGEIERRRAAGKSDRKEPAAGAVTEARAAKPDARSEAKPDAKPEARPEATKLEARIDLKPEGKSEAKPEAKNEGKSEAKAEAKLEVKSEPKADRSDAKSDRAESRSEPVTRPDGDKPRSDKHEGERKAKKHDDNEARTETKSERSETRSDKSEAKSDKAEAKHEPKGDKPVIRSETRADKTDGKSESKSDGKSDAKDKSDPPKQRFTLQLSSFQDRAEAEAFLSAVKSAGFQPYLTEADVSGKGTFYRIRLGSYRSLDAANDAKADYEKAAKKTAQVMRL